MLKRSLLTLSPVLIGLLAGCATKQTWVPELEDAQKTYAEISQDPIVASLAAEDLQSAARQLQRAEDAAASFRKPQSVAHQARIAKLQTLTAQQRARALSANHGVQVALGQDPLLSDEKIAAATEASKPEPLIAAAISGSEADIQAQLIALSQQIASLQAQLAQSQAPAQDQMPLPVTAGDQTTAAATDERLLATPGQVTSTPIMLPAPVEEEIDPGVVLGAAMAAPEAPPETAPVTELTGSTQIYRKLRAMNAKPNTRGMSLLLGERYFDNGTDRLMSQRAARHLDNVAAVLKQNPGLDLFVEGHTDNESALEDSLNLSVNRTVSIKSALVLRGVEAERITTRGYGHTRPIAENSTPLGRLQNRRVELIFPVGQSDS